MVFCKELRYVLTPVGMNGLVHRSYHYMRRTFTEVRECAAAVEAHIMQAKARDCTKVVLFGESGIALVIEWAAKRAGLEFEQILQPDGKTGVPEKALGIIGECANEGAVDTLKALGCVSVYEVAEREQ